MKKPDTSYLETFYEVVCAITLSLERDEETTFYKCQEEQGRGGIYELAESLTDEFETLHGDREWDGDFFDEIDAFMDQASKTDKIAGHQRKFICHWETDYYDHVKGVETHPFQWFTNALGYDSDDIQRIFQMKVNDKIQITPDHLIIRIR